MRNQCFAFIATAIALAACSNEQATESAEATASAETRAAGSAREHFGEHDFEPVIRERPVDCELIVDGKTYIDGVCQESSMATGSAGFIISGEKYFAYLSINDDGTGSASWNGKPEATHAQIPLGEMRRDGDCWVGKRARLCSRDLSPEQEKALIAQQANGGILYPDHPGTAAICVRATGELEEGANLVLDRCSIPRDRIFRRAANGALSIDGHPELCLDLEAPGMMKPPVPVLLECGAGAKSWTHKPVDGGSGPIRSPGGLCATVPAFADRDTPFPADIAMRPCEDPRYEAVEFIYE